MSDMPARLHPVVAQAEFTRDMMRNLSVVFEAAAGDLPVTVEMCGHGVWAVTPDGARLFLGHRRARPTRLHA